ncbi:MAG: PD-(D/E)XK nuclease family protein, partial [Oscillospiraceae bacterium]|nr:PD-(D/E)XK nuclease family protein [Oscillospiraceae bacterium]
VQDHNFSAVSREGKNVFMVGDVKQSIYRFRMADPTIFLRKCDTFANAASAREGEARKVLLTKNFRSRREVVEAVNFVFSRILSRQAGELNYGSDERLYFGADYYLPGTGAETEYHLVDVADSADEKQDRTAEEAAFVADRIRALLDGGYPVQDDGAFRPCREEDIVILMRSPKSRMAAFSAALAKRNILCSGEESSSLFDAPEIAVVFSFLQIIDNPRQDVPLLAAMRSALGGFSPDRLAEIRAGHREGDFYDALCADGGADSRAFLALLEGLRRDGRELSADQLIWRLYDVLHAQAVFGAMPGGAQRRQNLIAFYRFACETTASGRRGVFDFVTYVREMMEQEKLPKLSGGGGGGVRIMSIHKSKGLEFPIVILCDLHKAFNTDDLKKMVLVHPQLGLGTVCVDEKRRIRYDTITRTAVSAALEKEAKAEEMRILYVAMTRAQEKLIMVHCQRGAGKMLQELCAVTDDPVPPQAVADAKSMGQWILLPLLQTPEASVLRQFAGVEDLPIRDCCGWQVSLWHNAPEVKAAAEREGERAAPTLTADTAKLTWQYGHGAATALPTKVTATQLKGREWDEEIREEGAPRAYGGDFPRPRFLQETTALTATEKGTAMHLVMQYLDFDRGADTVAAQVAAMAAKRLLTQQQAEAVDCGAVARFLDTPLCDRIRRSRRVYREQRFNLLVDGTILGADGAGEEIMLQGVVDCAFVEDGKLVIVDFKTDHVTVETVPGRAEHYRAQLEAYALALGRVLDLPVAEKVLYFFHTNSAINL